MKYANEYNLIRTCTGVNQVYHHLQRPGEGQSSLVEKITKVNKGVFAITFRIQADPAEYLQCIS